MGNSLLLALAVRFCARDDVVQEQGISSLSKAYQDEPIVVVFPLPSFLSRDRK